MPVILSLSHLPALPRTQCVPTRQPFPSPEERPHTNVTWHPVPPCKPAISSCHLPAWPVPEADTQLWGDTLTCVLEPTSCFNKRGRMKGCQCPCTVAVVPAALTGLAGGSGFRMGGHACKAQLITLGRGGDGCPSNGSGCPAKVQTRARPAGEHTLVSVCTHSHILA